MDLLENRTATKCQGAKVEVDSLQLRFLSCVAKFGSRKDGIETLEILALSLPTLFKVVTLKGYIVSYHHLRWHIP